MQSFSNLLHPFRYPSNRFRFWWRVFAIAALLVCGREIQFRLAPDLRVPLVWSLINDVLLSIVMTSAIGIAMWGQRGRKLKEYPFSKEYYDFPPLDWFRVLVLSIYSLAGFWLIILCLFFTGVSWAQNVFVDVLGAVLFALASGLFTSFFARKWEIEDDK